MRVAVTGSTGFIGRPLVAELEGAGHTVVRLVRKPPAAGEARWDPETGAIDPDAFRGADAVVHLAGEPIAAHRWTDAHKARVRASRREGTLAVAEALAKLGTDGPKVLVSASAIGYYGDRGDETLDEASSRGTGFLADVCAEWEAATTPAAEAGLRVVNVRSGIVLDPSGGALAKMLLPFRLFVGGRLGSGRQWFSWIARSDEVRAIIHCLTTDELAGPVNLVAPTAVTNAELTTALATVLHRPAVLPVPKVALRAVLGEMAGDLLASARVIPRRLLDTGFEFEHPLIEPALQSLLGHA